MIVLELQTQESDVFFLCILLNVTLSFTHSFTEMNLYIYVQGKIQLDNFCY